MPGKVPEFGQDHSVFSLFQQGHQTGGTIKTRGPIKHGCDPSTAHLQAEWDSQHPVDWWIQTVDLNIRFTELSWGTKWKPAQKTQAVGEHKAPRDSKVPCSLSTGGFRGLPNQTRKEIHSAQNKYNYIIPTALGKIEKTVSNHSDQEVAVTEQKASELTASSRWIPDPLGRL